MNDFEHFRPIFSLQTFSTHPYHAHHDDRHLGDVEDDGEEEGGQDVDGQVDGGGVPPLTISKSDQIGPNRENSKSPLFLQNRF